MEFQRWRAKIAGRPFPTDGCGGTRIRSGLRARRQFRHCAEISVRRGAMLDALAATTARADLPPAELPLARRFPTVVASLRDQLAAERSVLLGDCRDLAASSAV